MIPKIPINLKHIYLLILLMLCVGCSHGPVDLTSPPPGGAVGDNNIPQNDDLTPPEPVHYAEGHIPWGLWQFSYDKTTGEIIPLQIRDASAHWDVTAYLQPPNCNDCLGIKVISMTASMLKLSVSLKNPTALTGRDVRGILITDDATFSLDNADAYTSLFDNGGAIILNPFKPFAVDDPQRKFLPGVIKKREYHIAYNTWPPNFSNLLYAVDASWPTNCKEPYDINVEATGQLYDYGGSLDVTIEALDWQDDVSKVALFSDEVLGTTILLDKIDATHWKKTITNMLNAPAGTYRFRVQANSPNPADLSLSDYFTTEIDEGICTADTNNLPPEADALPFGDDVASVVCLPDDQSDYYTFTIPPGQSAQGTLDLSATFTPTSMKLLDESLAMVTSTSVSAGQASINLGAYFLLPGIYYVQVLTNNPDYLTFYTLENNGEAFIPSYGPVDSPWPVIRHDQRRTGKSPYLMPSRWAMDWIYTKDEAETNTGPVIGKDGVIFYTVMNPLRLRAVKPDGKLGWELPLPFSEEGNDLAVGWDGVIYVPANTSLYGIRPDSTIKWTYNGSGIINWAPLIKKDGHLIVGEDGVAISCIKPNNKKVVWSYSLGATDKIIGMALGDDDKIYVTLKPSQLLCLNPDGSLNYSRAGGPIPLRPPVVETTGEVYYPADGNFLHAVNASGSTEMWSYDMSQVLGSSTCTPVLDSGALYMYMTSQGYINAVNSTTGVELWKGDTAYTDSCSNLILDGDGNIYTALMGEGAVVWLDSTNGKHEGMYFVRYKPNEQPSGDFVVGENQRVYSLSNRVLIAFRQTPLPEQPDLVGEFPIANAVDSHVFLTDLNGDGHDDIIARNFTNKELRVFNGATGIALWNPVQYEDNQPPSEVQFGPTAIGDFDGDSLGDVVTAAYDLSDTTHIYVYDGSSGTEMADITGDYTPFGQIILHDVIGGPFYTPDGQLDITGAQSSVLSVYNGATFNRDIDLDMFPDADTLLYWFESNGDNHPDPLVYHFNDTYGPLDGSLLTASLVYLWNGTDYYWFYATIGANLNNDDVPDCLAYTNRWHIEVADGASGAILDEVQLTGAGNDDYSWMFDAAADLNGDGYDDLVTAQWDTSSPDNAMFILMYSYDEAGSYIGWQTFPVTADNKKIWRHGLNPILCDVDGNGLADIITLELVVLGKGKAQYRYDLLVLDGRFGTEMMRWALPGDFTVYGWLAGGDVNGDGNLDFTLYKDSKIEIYTFNTPMPSDPATRPWLHPMKNLRNNMCAGDDD